jgi:Peptidase A4 family
MSCAMIRRSRLVGFGVVVVLVLVFLTIKLVPASSGGKVAEGFSDAPFGSFSGYAWVGGVHSVGASFTVPRIASGSPLSQAATWIGAQGQGPPARFVQIGAVESRFWFPRKQKTVDVYYTFWSDVARHFKAKLLFPVNPGDTLSASLVLANKQWMLAIADNTSGKKTHLSIAGEAQAPFNQAEWTQEDPGKENDHARYPRITAPVFQHLTVNSSQPAPIYSQWMSVNHGNLTPTVVHDDSFTLRQAPAVGVAGRQYLRLVTAALAVRQRFQTERSNWTPKTPYTQIVSASSQMIEATQKAERALLSARWSKQIGGLVRSAADANAVFLERARPPALLTATTFAAWNSALTEASLRAGRADSKLRLALGLPAFGFAQQTPSR